MADSANSANESGTYIGTDLAGKVALVTGAGQNIGRAIALSLAAGGAKIAVNTRSNAEQAREVAQEIRALGSAGEVFVADIADPAQVQSMVQQVLSRFGRLDILVMNAASREHARFEDITYEDWRRVLAVNLDSVFHCVKACLPALKRSGDARIITFGGVASLLGSKDAHVTVSKHGVVGLTRILAQELAEYGIRVNCISPGQIETVRGPNNKAAPLMDVPLGRKGRPPEIAGMVRCLCGAAGAYTTGQTIHINGGVFKSPI